MLCESNCSLKLCKENKHPDLKPPLSNSDDSWKQLMAWTWNSQLRNADIFPHGSLFSKIRGTEKTFFHWLLLHSIEKYNDLLPDTAYQLTKCQFGSLVSQRQYGTYKYTHTELAEIWLGFKAKSKGIVGRRADRGECCLDKSILCLFFPVYRYNMFFHI